MPKHKDENTKPVHPKDRFFRGYMGTSTQHPPIAALEVAEISTNKVELADHARATVDLRR